MKGNLLLLKGGLVAASDGIRTRDILVRDGKVAAIGTGLDIPEETVVVEAGGLLHSPSPTSTSISASRASRPRKPSPPDPPPRPGAVTASSVRCPT